MQTRPTTTVLVWPKLLQQWQEPEEKTIVGEQWPRVYNTSTEFGEKTVGVKFGSYVQWHVRPEKHVKGTPAFFLAGPNKVCFRMTSYEKHCANCYSTSCVLRQARACRVRSK